ncbi:acetyltransferase (isoleucine patch superfamily) [Candidatus Methanoperedens nitroreducens]|uniref:Acetyltransferase (Isoleucine patch superfamily) n=1 Tax=Candidatus Methanoperedens nitratireducens TaxID=1392998 RepID=A0A062UZF2_9EURY|nr:acyltransferase [Candidatus Methanoperedens nitroreducens]KCZ72306.1 acetyltransferase (isoleucine patch superfamily) [Candidatus Methanoperedens nitroreducens]MDJ1420770.1 acyltransferase [Candidatus Methanoperedens sp.]
MDRVELSRVQQELFAKRKSSLRMYQEMMVGSHRFLDLLKYELITSIFSPLPGALGLYLRKQFYRSLFKNIGRNVFFGKDITLRQPCKIKVGHNTIIDDCCQLIADGENSTGIELGSNVILNQNVRLKGDGSLKIGDNTKINSNCSITFGDNVKIGKNVLIGGYSSIIGALTHRFDRTDIPIIAQGKESKGGIIIEDNVWIGASVVILNGVSIGKDSIIGAGSVVTKSIPEFSIAFGVPARVVKRRK